MLMRSFLTSKGRQTGSDPNLFDGLQSLGTPEQRWDLCESLQDGGVNRSEFTSEKFPRRAVSDD